MPDATHVDTLRELDVNPVRVMPQGVLAVDALIRCIEPVSQGIPHV